MDLVEQVRQNIKESVGTLRARLGAAPEVGIILGSGLSSAADVIEDPRVLAYDEIPHFPVALILGHPGRVVSGKMGGTQVLALQGRAHYYEGYTMAGTAFPVKVLAALGVTTLITACAAGSISASVRTGELMMIVDHVNLMGDNPLIGPSDAWTASPFVDLGAAYDPSLRAIARRIARRGQIGLKDGVYVAVTGPSYETPAEVRMLSRVGDAVGMSVVPEVIVARYEGMRVAGFAAITNSHVDKETVDHETVIGRAEEMAENLGRLITGIITDPRFQPRT